MGRLGLCASCPRIIRMARCCSYCRCVCNLLFDIPLHAARRAMAAANSYRRFRNSVSLDGGLVADKDPNGTLFVFVLLVRRCRVMDGVEPTLRLPSPARPVTTPRRHVMASTEPRISAAFLTTATLLLFSPYNRLEPQAPYTTMSTTL